MVTELEKQFFDTFGIEPIACNDCIECYEANTTPFPWCEKLDYPQITDYILLELICIIGAIFICTRDKETLKEHILVQCMVNNKDIKPQVQALFKEG